MSIGRMCYDSGYEDIGIRCIREEENLMATKEGRELDLLKPGMSYPVWSPYDAVDAADAMLKVLKNAESEDHG